MNVNSETLSLLVANGIAGIITIVSLATPEWFVISFGSGGGKVLTGLWEQCTCSAYSCSCVSIDDSQLPVYYYIVRAAMIIAMLLFTLAGVVCCVWIADKIKNGRKIIFKAQSSAVASLFIGIAVFFVFTLIENSESGVGLPFGWSWGIGIAAFFIGLLADGFVVKSIKSDGKVIAVVPENLSPRAED